jgi:Na+-driven multidrug efflux pump
VAFARSEAQSESVLKNQPTNQSTKRVFSVKFDCSIATFVYSRVALKMNALLERHASSRRVVRRRATWREVLRELKELFILAGPAILTNVTNFGTGLTDTVFVGHLPLAACTLGGDATHYLAGVGLANTWMSLIYFLSNGFNFAMDTLVSQNFGRGNLSRCSELFQTALFVIAWRGASGGDLVFYFEHFGHCV